MTQAAAARYRKDYRAPDFHIDQVDLRFELDEAHTLVHATLNVRRATPGDGPLELDGEDLELLALRVDGRELSGAEYETDGESLRVFNLPEHCVLETEVRIFPQRNTRLEGLYQSNGLFCTQCEAEGFRRITYFLDRPDVMSRYTTTLVADKSRYPVLLSNGNRVKQEDLGDGRHLARWEDPFPKPTYLFALVAGNLARHTGTFITASQREIRLEIWTEPRNHDKCEFALGALQRAMRWDEEVFGLEYDLDLYMIVAVHDFNMGAMENKGLNIFNDKYVLARPDTATDADYEHIEGVIGHEYFHNWTGNRVTCRDWFQLTLKEGLTVFRDEQFSADMTSRAVKRIEDVKLLRAKQFAEDAGPMAHPIRPESYIEMNNFYTVTVYSKGSEVIRMLHTLLGEKGFRKGMDLYFQRHDGQAVTCDDFRAAMADANGMDLTQFERWYTQHGTPTVEADETFNPENGEYTLTLRQSGPDQGNGRAFQPMHMPVRLGLLGADGAALPLCLQGEDASSEAHERVLDFTQAEQSFVFTGLQEKPIPSLFRHFSAPVQLKAPHRREDWLLRMGHDPDPFNRWDALQTLAQEWLLDQADAWTQGQTLTLDPMLLEGFAKVLADPQLDHALKALALDPPEERVLAGLRQPIRPAALHAAREFLLTELASQFQPEWQKTFTAMQTGPYRYHPSDNAKRRLKNLALNYLVRNGDEPALTLAHDQFTQADNMTDHEAAFKVLLEVESPLREQALTTFHQRWQPESLVLDKWFRHQAAASHSETFTRVQTLTRHPDFSPRNPNRLRALLHTFSHDNPAHFHREDGAGYRLLTDFVLQLDPDNPQLASRLVSALNGWKGYESPLRDGMREALERIAGQPGLSRDVHEIVEKNLKD